MLGATIINVTQLDPSAAGDLLSASTGSGFATVFRSRRSALLTPGTRGTRNRCGSGPEKHCHREVSEVSSFEEYTCVFVYMCI